MRRSLILALSLVAADAPKKAEAPPTLTRDERLVLRGFVDRAELVRLRAQRELEELGREQDEYLGRVAARLGIPVATLKTDYVLDVSTGAVTKREAKP